MADSLFFWELALMVKRLNVNKEEGSSEENQTMIETKTSESQIL